MKRFWSLCLLALLSLILSVPSGIAQEALFSFTPPKDGESVLVTDVSRIEIDAEVKADGSVLANLNQLQSKLEQSRIELLAVRDGRIRKIQTTYEALEALNKQNEVEERKDFPVLGKTYIVEDIGQGALSVTYPDGEPPGGEEVEYIRNNIRDLNGIIDTNELLVGRKLTIGERDPALEQELRSGLFETTDMGEVKELSVVFRGLKKEREFRCGVFGIDILFYAPLDQSGSIELRLSGEVLIILDNCWLLSVHMEGPIAMSARFEERGQMADLTGSGRAIITKDYEYSE